jgi:hypothetical protein
MSEARQVLERLPEVRRLRKALKGEALALEMDARAAGVKADRTRGGVWISAADLLDLIDLEVLVIGILTREFLEKRTLSEEDWARIAQAAARIGAARDHVRNP